ncbi:MAG TPA: hypothetical protein P5084_06160 [Paludibacter sp.]|nr:hypothetical protein [Paludibacter sp.]
MKALNKSIEMMKAGSAIFIAIFILIACLSAHASANATGSNEQSVSQIDQTPMYADPKYTDDNLNTNSSVNDQNKLYAPPPQSPNAPDQIDDTPVSSSVIPLMIMALGLFLWKIHYQLKKAKK